MKSIIVEKTEGLMTTKDVSEWLQLTEQTIKQLCRAKKIPCIKVSRRWRFNKEELEKWSKGQQGEVANG